MRADSKVCVSCSVGGALVEMGESMRRLAEVKDSLDIDVKQNFIDPFQTIVDKDLKDIQVGPEEDDRIVFFSSGLQCSKPGITYLACSQLQRHDNPPEISGMNQEIFVCLFYSCLSYLSVCILFSLCLTTPAPAEEGGEPEARLRLQEETAGKDSRRGAARFSGEVPRGKRSCRNQHAQSLRN